MKSEMGVAVLLILAGVGLAGCSRKTEDHTARHAPAAGKTMYQCPMHPQIIQDSPGDCPICNMRLVPVVLEEGKEVAGKTESHVPVTITPERQQLIGVRTAVVERRPLDRLIRASARVAYDPDLYNAIADYREAARAARRGGADGKSRAEGLLSASRLRLRQMGISPAQIDKMAADGAPANLLTPQTGVVWVYAQVYDEEAAQVKPGQIMEVSSPAFPGRRFKGTVRSVDAVVDPQTRTLKVRAEAADPEGVLRPEMYIDATIHVDFGTRLALPEEALMDSGTRQWVFVAGEEGRFEPRDVVLGREADGYFEVVKGLEEGERVVASANFLVDSESRLKAAVAGAAHVH